MNIYSKNGEYLLGLMRDHDDWMRVDSRSWMFIHKSSYVIFSTISEDWYYPNLRECTLSLSDIDMRAYYKIELNIIETIVLRYKFENFFYVLEEKETKLNTISFDEYMKSYKKSKAQ